MSKKIIISILFAALTFTVKAQQNYTLDDYRQKVFEYSQALKQAKEGVKAAEAQTKSIKTGFLPRLDISADANYQANKVEFELAPGSVMALKPWGYSVNGVISQNIYSGSAVRNQYKASKIGEQIAKDAEKLTVDNIYYAADMYYWQLSAMSAMLKVSQRNVELVGNLLKIIKTRFEDGLISKNDVLMVETRLKESQLQLANIQQKHKSAMINFNVMMGAESNSESTASQSIDIEMTLPESLNLDEVLLLRPDFKIATNQIALEQQTLKAKMSEFLPRISAGFKGTYGSQMINFDGSGMANGILFGQINVPVFQWNKRKHIRAISFANITSKELQRDNTRDMISGELSNAWYSLNQSLTELEIAKSTLSIAQESLDINTLSYNEGRLTVLDVLSSQLSWLLAYNSVINTNLQYKASIAQYNKVVGLYSN